YPVPRSVLVINALLAPFWLAANRRLVTWLRRRREGPARAVLVGDPDTVSLAVGHLDRAAAEVEVVALLGDIDTVCARVRAERADVVLLLVAGSVEALYHEGLDALEQEGVGTSQIVRPRGSLLRWGDVGEIGGIAVVARASHAVTPSQSRL